MSGKFSSIQVTGEAPAVELASSSLSGEANSTTVLELPLNGRDWTSLAILQLGVVSLASAQTPLVTTSGGKTNREIRGFGDELSISGTRPQQSNYRIDGVNVNDYANGGPAA